MANLKLVGAVAIKVRPDATGFRKETQAELTKELRDVKAKVPVTAELDEGKTKEDAKKLEKDLEKTIHWEVKLDHDSVKAAQKKFNALFDATETIKFKMGDQASIDAAAAKLEDLRKKARVSIVISDDKKGYEEVLAKIEKIRRENIVLPPITFSALDDGEMDRLEKEMRDKIDRIPVKIKYNQDVQGLRKIVKDIDAELAKVSAVETDVILKPANLAFAKARMEEELSKLTVKIEYENNLASLQAARRQLLELLPEKYRTGIVTKLDEASLLKSLAEIDAMIAAHESKKDVKADIEPKVKPKASAPDFIKVAAEIKALTRNQTVGVFVKLNNAGILLAAAKLTGLRAAARWSEELGRSLGTLDRNLPIVAAVTLTLTQLSGVLTNLTANAFSLGNDLGTVVRMGGVLLPAAVLGLASVMTVLTGVFKDFGAAVNGDSKAIEKLTESGKKAAAQIRVVFQDIRETVSRNFWDQAGDSMLKFSEIALPKVRDGLAGLATSLGGIFARILDSITLFAQQNGIEVFFSNLNRGFDIAQTGMASFMSGFLTLASVGSTVFPRLGKAFEAWAGRFDGWVQRLAADGTLNRWIDRGVEGLQNLFKAGGSLVKVWENIGTAAQAAGAHTLQSFAGTMERLDRITAGASFQRNLQNIFRGAREGSENFKKSLEDVGPVMDTFSVTIKNTLAKSGATFGAFAQDVGDLLSSPNLTKGMNAFLDGLKAMFEELRPAMAPVSEIIRTFGEVLGQVAADSGPLFRNLFTQLASVLTTAWHALEPFLPGLIQIGTSIINILGPAMTKVAESLIPAFASGLQDLGDGMVPIIGFLADMAVGFTNWLSSLSVPTVAALVAGVLSLGAAFRFAATMIPLAKDAMVAFGVAAAVAGVRAQLMVPVLGVILAGLAALTAGLVTDFATQQANATPYANDWAAAIREDAEAAKELGHVVQSSQIRTAIKNLFDSGAFDAAHDLGISTKLLTDAAVKGGPALTEIEKRVRGAKDAYRSAAIEAARAGEGVTSYSDKVGKLSPAVERNYAAALKVEDILKKVRASAKAAGELITAEEVALRANGMMAEDAARKNALLNDALEKTPGLAGAASSASRTLTDAFSSSTAKVDAMRKTLDLLVGKDPRQQINETLGAYVSGFNDLKETVTPLAGKMQELGEAVYGEGGFLNVAGGNKAVLQVNQALIDQVNNVWAGAKQVYDNAMKQGENAQQAFAAAKKFIDDRKGDYQELGNVSGLNADRVMGQWEAVFGKEWVLKVSFNGLTEVTAKAQAMVNFLGGTFDGEEFLAYLNLNPDEAIKALNGASDEVALRWVTKEFKAKLALLPDNVEDQLRRKLGMLDEEWVNADLSTILSVAKETPGLAEALIAIHNGVENVDLEAVIKAAADHTSVEAARNQIDEAAAQRKAPIQVEVVYADETSRKLAEIEENKRRLEVPTSITIDANTQPADSKVDVTQGKVDTLTGPKAVPDIDVNNVPANTKLDDSQSKADKFGNSRPNPFVDADTGTATGKVSAVQDFLDRVNRSRPNPVVTATDNASGTLRGILGLINSVSGIHYAQIMIDYREANRNPALAYMQDGFANGGITERGVRRFAMGGISRPVHRYASGGIENHVAQIQRAGGPVRIWAEPETKAEAYIPYAMAKRPRSVRILGRVASDFGYELVKKSSNSYANGGINGTPGQTTNHRTASVHIGQLITTDPAEAVRKIRISQQDALAVAGISLNGA